MSKTTASPQVALYVTCLVDVMRPSVGFAAIQLLQQAGCEVVVPKTQTCCGQPAYNSGDKTNAITMAKQLIEQFQSYEYVVVPSGSCAGMIKAHYPSLLDDEQWQQKAQALAAKTFELTEFLADIIALPIHAAEYAGKVCYHDSCAGLRELAIKQQPRQLLQQVPGLQLQELEQAEVCCGFGGLFCMKYPDISSHMGSRKIDDITACDADTLLAGDLGCLLTISGQLARQGSSIKVRHVAEVLAGMTVLPAIGETEG